MMNKKIKKKSKSSTPLLLCSPKCPGFTLLRAASISLGLRFSDSASDLSKADVVMGYKGQELDTVFRESPLKCRIGKFPSSNMTCEKHKQAEIFDHCMQISPEAFNFWPETFVVPRQLDALMKFMGKGKKANKKKKKKTMICKPVASSQGDGIFLFDDAYEFKNRLKSGALRRPEHICQKYISNPLLLGGLKFDLRLYVLIESLEPLVCHVCSEGMARFCTVPYQKPTSKNYQQIHAHLTNYSLNRASSDYQHSVQTNDETASKRTLTTFWRQLAEEYPDCDLVELWEKTRACCYTTLHTIAPLLQAASFWYPEQDYDHGRSFQILGLDVLIDSNFQPFLLEANSGPSLSIDSIVEIDDESEVRANQKVCRCMKNPNMHVHKISQIDQIIKSVVLQGALSIILNLNHSTRDAWEILGPTPELPNLSMVNYHLVKIFHRSIQKSNLRWGLRKELTTIFPRIPTAEFDLYITKDLLSLPAGNSAGNLIALYFQYYKLMRKLATLNYAKKKLDGCDPLLYHFENYGTENNNNENISTIISNKDEELNTVKMEALELE